MAQTSENTANTKAKGGFFASLRKLLFMCGLLALTWLLITTFGPRVLPLVRTNVVTHELGIVPTNNQPLRRHSFNETIEQQRDEIATLHMQIAMMEKRLQTIESRTPDNTGNVTGEPVLLTGMVDQDSLQTAAIAKETQELREALIAQEAANNERIRLLQAKLAVLEAKPDEVEAQRQRMATIETAVTQQHTLIEAVKSEIARAQLQTVRQLSALSSFIPMKEAALRGQPFDVPLTQMLNFTHGNRKVEELAGQLKPIAHEGMPSLPDLKHEFNGLLLKAMNKPQGKDSFTGNLRALISIRKTGEQPGESLEAILARAEARLKQNNLESCIEQLKSLPETSKEIMAPWIAKASRYVTLRSLIDEMQLALTKDVDAVQTSMPEQPQYFEPAIAKEPAAETLAPAAAPVAKPETKPAKPAAQPKAAAKPEAKTETKSATPKAKPLELSKPKPATEPQSEKQEAEEERTAPAPKPAAKRTTDKFSYPGN